MPEFLNFYRPVLDENPELRKNTLEAKQKLELEVKNLYLVTIAKQKIEKDEKLKASQISEPENSETVKIVRFGLIIFTFFVVVGWIAAVFTAFLN